MCLILVNQFQGQNSIQNRSDKDKEISRKIYEKRQEKGENKIEG